MTKLVDLNKYICQKCGHTWIPRKANPSRCPNPKCHSYLWGINEIEDSAQQVNTFKMLGVCSECQEKTQIEVVCNQQSSVIPISGDGVDGNGGVVTLGTMKCCNCGKTIEVLLEVRLQYSKL